MRSLGLSHLSRSCNFFDINDINSTEIRSSALFSDLKNYISTFCTENILQDLDIIVGSRSDFNSLAKLLTTILTISKPLTLTPEDSQLLLKAFKYLIYSVKNENKNEEISPLTQSNQSPYRTPHSISFKTNSSLSKLNSSLNKSETDSSNLDCSEHFFSISLNNSVDSKANNEVNTLEKQIDDLYSQKNKLKLVLASALREKDASINEERQQRECIEDQLNKTITDLNISEKSRLNIELKFQQLCKEADDLMTKFKKLEQKNSNRKQSINSLNEQIKNLTIENEKLKNKVSSLSSQLISITKLGMNSKIDISSISIPNIDSDKEPKDEEITKIKQKMEDDSQKFSSIISSKDEQIKTLQDRICLLQRRSDESLSILQNQLIHTQRLLSIEKSKGNSSIQEETEQQHQYELQIQQISHISDILTQLFINLLENSTNENSKFRVNQKVLLTMNLNQKEINEIKEAVVDSKEILYKYSPRSITLLNSIFIDGENNSLKKQKNQYSNEENDFNKNKPKDELIKLNEIENESSEVLSLKEELDEVKKDNDFFAEVVKNFHNGKIEMADQISFLQRENERLNKLVKEKANFYKLCLEETINQHQKNHQKEIERMEQQFNIQLRQMKDSILCKSQKIKQLKIENNSIKSELHSLADKNQAPENLQLNEDELKETVSSIGKVLGICFQIEGDWDRQKVLKATTSLVKRTLFLEKEIKKKSL